MRKRRPEQQPSENKSCRIRFKSNCYRLQLHCCARVTNRRVGIGGIKATHLWRANANVRSCRHHQCTIIGRIQTVVAGGGGGFIVGHQQSLLKIEQRGAQRATRRGGRGPRVFETKRQTRALAHHWRRECGVELAWSLMANHPGAVRRQRLHDARRFDVRLAGRSTWTQLNNVIATLAARQQIAEVVEKAHRRRQRRRQQRTLGDVVHQYDNNTLQRTEQTTHKHAFDARRIDHQRELAGTRGTMQLHGGIGERGGQRARRSKCKRNTTQLWHKQLLGDDDMGGKRTAMQRQQRTNGVANFESNNTRANTFNNATQRKTNTIIGRRIASATTTTTTTSLALRNIVAMNARANHSNLT
jgi:hypothetical protein